MTRKCLAVMALVTMFVSVASAQDAKTVIANASKAMGYTNLNTIEYSGPLSHEGAGLGQWMSPTKGWHQNTVKNLITPLELRSEQACNRGPAIQRRDCCPAAADWTLMVRRIQTPPPFLPRAPGRPGSM